MGPTNWTGSKRKKNCGKSSNGGSALPRLDVKHAIFQPAPAQTGGGVFVFWQGSIRFSSCQRVESQRNLGSFSLHPVRLDSFGEVPVCGPVGRQLWECDST